MEASTNSTLHDIGPTVAIVGTKGWRCCLCHTSFPRSFSIEHHMIMCHHNDQPPPQQSTATAEHSGIWTRQEESGLPKSDCNVEKHSVVNCDAPSVTEGVQSSLSTNHTAVESPNMAETQSIAEEGRHMQDSNLKVKVEAGEEYSEMPPTQAALTKEHLHTQKALDVVRGADQSLPVSCSTGPKLQMPPYQDTSDSDGPDCPEAKAPRMQLVSGSTDSANASCKQVSGSSEILSVVRDKRMKPGSCKPYKRRICSCGEVFDTKPDFKHHRRVVHCKLNHKVFICHICGTQYSYKRGLNRHLAEKGFVPVPCTVCSKQFHDHMSMEAHRVSCHTAANSDLHEPCHLVTDEGGDVIQSGVSDTSYGMRDGDPWECPKCKQLFIEKHLYRKHLIACRVLRFENGHQRFYCNLCNAWFQWLKNFYTHYINDHKLAPMAELRNSPAHLSPFMGNSPVPSPAPSLTLEINTAMAEVDLNHSSAPKVAENSSLHTAVIDLTTDDCTKQGADEVSRNEDLEDSSKYSSHQSLASSTSASEQASIEDVADIVSDKEDNRRTELSTDSDSDWEVISDRDDDNKQANMASEKSPRPGGERFCNFSEHPPFGHPSPHSHHRLPFHPPPPPPPPPPPGPNGSSQYPFHYPPPPPPPHFHHHHFHHHHHQHNRGRGFGLWRMFRGRGCPSRHPGPAWFGPPGGCCDDNSSEHAASPAHAETQPSEAATASTTAASDVLQAAPSTSATTPPSKDGKPLQAEENPSGNNANFSHRAQYMAWAGKLADKKLAKMEQKKRFFFIFKNCLQAKTFSFYCPECFEMFSLESDLHSHTQTQHVTSQSNHYVCLVCWQQFVDPVLYNKHIHQHCRDALQSRGHGHGSGHWPTSGGFGMHRLHKLLHKTLGPSAWNFHHSAQGKSSGHSEKEGSDGGEPEDFKECPFCPKKFRANSREHFFERHVNAHFGVETYNFKCGECGKTFLEKCKFTAHQSTHSIAPYVCSECGKSYKSRASLSRHLRIHTGERPYKCEVCGEGFIENRELVRHRSVHTGQAAFTCQDCGAGFTLKTSLQSHVKKQHPQLSHTAFLCPDCSERFLSLAELDQHQQTCPGGQRQTQSGATVIKEETTSMDLD